MKASRCFPIWTALAVCAVTVLGAMTWLTRSVLASEREQATAEARADLEERTRLALWRMDTYGATIIASENRRAPAAGEVARITPPDPAVKLHFELRQSGRLVSPEITPGDLSAASTPARETLAALRRLLGNNPLPGDEWSVLTCAAEAGETAWNSVPKMATQQKTDNRLLRQTKGGSQVRSDADYQFNSNGAELAQRAKTVGETVLSQAAQPGVPESERISQAGTLRAVWVGGELLLLRQFTATVAGIEDKGVQGVWLDHAVLARRLLAEATDLLPHSRLLPSGPEAGQDPLTFVSFPFRLQRNEVLAVVAPPPNLPLLIGWAAVVLALLTTGWLVYGILRLSDRRASFVSAVTHELRTPLTTFRLYSDMLETGAVKPEKRGDYLRVLSREADRLSHLVENVLSFSRIERGNARSIVRETTVHDLLESTRDRLQARLATAGMTLELIIGSEQRVRVDSAAVEHILFNLTDNAAKYASTGVPPVLTIQALASGRHLQLIVSDHGPGIPPNERRRIFRAFHKSAREAAESRPGVGLGLALSRRLAKSLGGSLDCADAPSGARFVLRLPLAGSPS